MDRVYFVLNTICCRTQIPNRKIFPDIALHLEIFNKIIEKIKENLICLMKKIVFGSWFFKNDVLFNNYTEAVTLQVQLFYGEISYPVAVLGWGRWGGAWPPQI